MFRKTLTVAMSCLLAAAGAVAADAKLDEAQRLIVAEKYDPAVRMLDEYVAAHPDSDEAHLLLAQAHHWGKNLAKAKSHYQTAARLDGRHALEIIPLLDETKEWAEIVKLTAAVVKEKTTPPSALGALATAYRELGKAADAERVIAVVAATEYRAPYEQDYKNYVLAYHSLWSKNSARCMTHLTKIDDKALLRYAANSAKFESLFADPEFVRLTGKKTK